MEFNKDILNENWKALRDNPIITGSTIDNVTNDALGDYWIFVATILEKEKEDKEYFTTDWDRDRELPFLFRQSQVDYIKDGIKYDYGEYIEGWLDEYNKEFKKQSMITVTEVCPNCGQEITISVSEDTQYLKFCPFCGEETVFLCSECMEKYGDCNKNIGFCKNKCHL